MNDFNRSMAAGARGGSLDTSVDQGLRSFMLGVYNKLALGIALAGVLAYVAGTVEPVTALVFGTPLYMVVQWGPIALLLGSMFFMKNPSPLGTAILYWSIVTMIGLGLGIWVMMAEQSFAGSTRGGIQVGATYGTIAKAFFITASTFGALSLWGYTTKRNLTGFGSAMVMAIWGVLALSLVSLLFPPSSTFEWIVMAAVFVLSAGIVAWQTQELKQGYYAQGGDARSLAVMTNWGALNFFISFVNMFRIVMMVLSSRE
ncbi:MAG: Bax inhibitor-1/YccA family protein [Pseudomonadota bacterium]